MTTMRRNELNRVFSHHRDNAHLLISQVAADGAMAAHAQKVIDQYLLDLAGYAHRAIDLHMFCLADQASKSNVNTSTLTPDMVKELVIVLENIRLTEWLDLGGTPNSLAALHTACKELEQGKV